MTTPGPYGSVHHPSLRTQDEAADAGQGLDCFLDASRPCTATCMAWQLPPEGPDYKDQHWASCLLLVNAHRLGKHQVLLARSADEALRVRKNQAADHARTHQSPPPKVT